ncbi:MAG: tRNA pseudouridine synthase A [Calditrichaeota bacterium]|nr:tRNA pseudouridine synthase A [Calditrichota bacterium]
MRIRLSIAYDGADFAGWQVQRSGRTVQGELARALASFYGGRELRVIAAGRTDAGVHATGQVVHFDPPVKREPDVIARGLNSLLPADIRVWRARVTDERFHARYCARGRRYAYRLLRRGDLFLRRYGHVAPAGFDPHAAEPVARELLGRHDFRTFATKPDPRERTTCELRAIRWREDEHGWVCYVEADRFVRRMVRALISVLIAGARGEFGSDQVRAAFANDGSVRLSPPLPACGLALHSVLYGGDDHLDRPPASLWGDFP